MKIEHTTGKVDEKGNRQRTESLVVIELIYNRAITFVMIYCIVITKLVLDVGIVAPLGWCP